MAGGGQKKLDGAGTVSVLSCSQHATSAITVKGSTTTSAVVVFGDTVS